MPTAATMPAARMAHRSAGYHPGLQPRSTKDQTTVASTAVPRAMRGNHSTRRLPEVQVPPMPTRAPTAGARATV